MQFYCLLVTEMTMLRASLPSSLSVPSIIKDRFTASPGARLVIWSPRGATTKRSSWWGSMPTRVTWKVKILSFFSSTCVLAKSNFIVFFLQKQDKKSNWRCTTEQSETFVLLRIWVTNQVYSLVEVLAIVKFTSRIASPEHLSKHSVDTLVRQKLQCCTIWKGKEFLLFTFLLAQGTSCLFTLGAEPCLLVARKIKQSACGICGPEVVLTWLRR